MGSSDGMPDEGWRRRKGAPARFRSGWPDHIISAVIKARDAFAHSAPIVGGIEGGAALHWASQGPIWLLRYHALTEIGSKPSRRGNEF